MVKFRRDKFAKYRRNVNKWAIPLQPRTVLGSFGVMFMSCKVNFHVVRSALHISMCILKKYDLKTVKCVNIPFILKQ